MQKFLSKSDKRLTVSYLVLAVVWPFMGFLVAIAKPKSRLAKHYIVFIFILFGLTFSYIEYTSDSYRIYQKFLLFNIYSIEDFLNILMKLYSPEDKFGDIYLPSVLFILSRITDSMGLLYAVLAGVYGYFFAKYFQFLSIYLPTAPKRIWVHTLLFVLCLIYIRYSAVNGVRFWTAFFLFLYTSLNYIRKREIKFIPLIISTLLIHIGFSLAILIFFTFWVTRKNLKIIYALLIIGLSINISNFDIFLPLKSEMKIEGVTLKKLNDYTKESYSQRLEERDNQRKQFMVLWQPLSIFFAIFSLFFIRFSGKINYSYFQELLYRYNIVFLSFLLIIWDIPTLSHRYKELFIVLQLTLMFILSYDYASTKFFKVMAILALAFNSLAIVVGLRVAQLYTSDFLYIGNLPYLIYEGFTR